MSKFLATALLLALVSHGTDMATGWDDKDFFSYCPPSRCGEHGPEIRFPFRLESSGDTSTSCGLPGMKLACSRQDDTILLDHPDIGRCRVTAIDYRRRVLKIIPLVGSLSPCPLQKIKPRNISSSAPFYAPFYEPCTRYDKQPGRIVRCSREFTASTQADRIVGPISCLSNATHFSYLVDARLSMHVLPSDCRVSSNGFIRIPVALDDGQSFNQRAKRILNFSETTVGWLDQWYQGPNCTYYDCQNCEQKGRRCAFSSQRNQAFCMPRGSHVKVIAATSSVATFVVLLLMVGTALYLSLKSKYNEEIHLKVEMFLKTYGTSKPTRYTTRRKIWARSQKKPNISSLVAKKKTQE